MDKKRLIGLSILALGSAVLWNCDKDDTVFGPQDAKQFSGSVSGRVQDQRGRAVPGALVTVYPGGVTTVSGDSGKFEIGNMAPGSYRFALSKADYRDTARQDSVRVGMLEAKRVDSLRLAYRYATVKGSVDLTGVGTQFPGIVVEDQDVATTVSPTGKFTLGRIEPGHVRLFAACQGVGYGVHELDLVAGDTVSSLSLSIDHRGGTVSGTVVDTAGRAISGAKVTSAGGQLSTGTDGSGRFSLPNVPPSAMVRVSSGSLATTLTGLVVPEGGLATVSTVQLGQVRPASRLPVPQDGIALGTISDSLIYLVARDSAASDTSWHVRRWLWSSGTTWKDSTSTNVLRVKPSAMGWTAGSTRTIQVRERVYRISGGVVTDSVTSAATITVRIAPPPDRTPPTLRKVSPARDTTVSYPVQAVLVSWAVSDNKKLDTVWLDSVWARVDSGKVSKLATLTTGRNVVRVVARDSAGNVSWDSLVVTRSAPSGAKVDSTLTMLFTEPGSLSPSFTRDTLVYRDTIGATDTVLKALVDPSDSTSKVFINDTLVPTKVLVTVKVPLSTASALVRVNVVASDNDTLKYMVNVVRRAASAAAIDSLPTLHSLSVDSSVLRPAFDSLTTTYFDTVAAGVANVTVRALASKSSSSVVIDGRYMVRDTMPGAGGAQFPPADSAIIVMPAATDTTIHVKVYHYLDTTKARTYTIRIVHRTANLDTLGIPGLVAYYPFNADANDESGHGNNGTVYGAALVADRFGNNNGAYLFDGSSAYIDCGSSSQLDMGPDSGAFSVWVRNERAMSPTGAKQMDLRSVFGRRDAGSNDGWGLTYGYWMGDGVTTTGDRIDAAFYGGYQGTVGKAIPLSRWVHLAGSFRAGKFQLYVDGDSVGTTNVFSGSTRAPSAHMMIGRHGNYSDEYNYHAGAIDDMRLFAQPLTKAQIAKLYHEGGWTGSGSSDSLGKLDSLKPLLGTLSPAFEKSIRSYADTVPAGTAMLDLRVVAASPTVNLLAGTNGLIGSGTFLVPIPRDTLITIRIKSSTGDSLGAYSVQIVHRPAVVDSTYGIPWNSSASYGSLTDARDGKIYKTVQIGTQRWMAENLDFSTDSSWCPSDSCQKYGRYYSWIAAMQIPDSFGTRLRTGRESFTQGVCPQGWHLPRDAEWAELASFVGADSAGLRLRSTTGWEAGDNGNDRYGFRAIPSGMRIPSNPKGLWIGRDGNWWTARESSAEYAYYRLLNREFGVANLSQMNEFYVNYKKAVGMSVRCVEGAISTDTLTTLHSLVFDSTLQVSPAFDSTTTSYVVTLAAGKTQLNVTPTTSSSAAAVKLKTNILASGSISHFSLAQDSVFDLVVSNPNTSSTRTYRVTVRWQAVFDSTYGVPWNSSASYGSLTDARDGKVYKTIRIGSQNWMAENLDYAVDSSWHYYGTSSDSARKYGRLYKWAAAMSLPDSCNKVACTGFVQPVHQGACPAGWHVPADAEWSVLTAFVGESSAGTILKSSAGWNWTSAARTGNGTDDYGFRILPAGYYLPTDGTFHGIGGTVKFWSATEYDAAHSWRRSLNNDLVGVDRDYADSKPYGISVRCVEGAPSTDTSTALANLSVGGGLSPSFHSDTLNYAKSGGSSSYTLQVTTSSSAATVKLDGTSMVLSSGTGSASIPAADTTIVLEVRNPNVTGNFRIYTIRVVQPPTFSVAAGIYSTSQPVALSTTTPGASIHYTLDGSAPTASSSSYGGPITVFETRTIRAIAVRNGVSSAEAGGTFTILNPDTLTTLHSLSIGGDTLRPVFDSLTTEYVDSLDASATSRVVSASPTSAAARVGLHGSSYSPSLSYSLNTQSDTTIAIDVMNTNTGRLRAYTIHLYHKGVSLSDTLRSPGQTIAFAASLSPARLGTDTVKFAAAFSSTVVCTLTVQGVTSGATWSKFVSGTNPQFGWFAGTKTVGSPAFVAGEQVLATLSWMEATRIYSSQVRIKLE